MSQFLGGITEVPRIRGFTLLELLATLVVVVVILVLLIPSASATSRRAASQIQNSTQLRGIHQALVIFSQSNKRGGGLGMFPGLNRDGTDGTIDVEDRFKLMLDGNYFTPEYVVSPQEDDPNIREWPQSGPFTKDHYSYAMLQVPPRGQRRNEWAETLNTQAVVVSDRNTGTVAQPASIWNNYRQARDVFGCTMGYTYPYRHAGWVGTITRNDNSTSFEMTHLHDTRYGSAPEIKGDHLFEAVGEDDAYLVHSGN